MHCPHQVLRSLNSGNCPLCGTVDEGARVVSVSDPPTAALTGRRVSVTDEPNVSGGGGSLDLDTMVAERDRHRAAQAKRSLAYFVQYGWHVRDKATLEWSWHHEAICMHVQRLLEEWRDARDFIAENVNRLSPEELEAGIKRIQRCQNLIINVPPGTLKSRIVSVYAIAWWWLHEPTWSVICLSANPKVANRDSMHTKELVQSAWYQDWFDVDWTINKDAVEDWDTTAGGRRQAKGLNANVVGERADALWCDDPNDPEKSDSEAIRDGVNTRWNGSVENRVNDERISVRLGIQQRVNQNDWTGYLLNKDAGYHLVCIPCEWDPKHPNAHTADNPSVYDWTDPRTKAGEVIQPSRFTDTVLGKAKKKGTIVYAGQYQQRPGAAGGNIFKLRDWRWFRFADNQVGQWKRPDECADGEARVIENVNSFDWLIITVDADFKANAGTSRVSILVMAALGPDRFVIDNRTGNLSFTKTVEMIVALRNEYPHTFRVVIEEKANGSAIIDVLTGKISGVVGVTPMGSKESRANASTPAVESGNVYLLDGAEWVHGGEIDFLGELSMFPTGTYDDQVDAFSQGMMDMNESPGVVAFTQLANV